MTPLAHAGHWAISLLYVLPVVLVGGTLAYQAWRDRRAADREKILGDDGSL